MEITGSHCRQIITGVEIIFHKITLNSCHCLLQEKDQIIVTCIFRSRHGLVQCLQVGMARGSNVTTAIKSNI